VGKPDVKDGISRRDFLNGVALTIGAGLAPLDLLRAAENNYPPALSGMRGSTDASAAAAHALRDGRKFAVNALPVEDTLDLVVIGAGISGLAAAYYFGQQRGNARILLLDNHDDFGGHARRCEMRVDGRLILGYGGSEAIEAPNVDWSENALALVSALGVDLTRFETAFDRSLYPGLGLSRGILFMREAFGVDKLVTGDPTPMVADDIPPDRLNARSAKAFIDDFPLDAASREKLMALYAGDRVDIGYLHNGALRRVQAERVVYAGYNSMLPYLMPELSQQQQTALAQCVKAPLVYVKLAARNWRAWVKAGVHEVTNPMGFYSRIKLGYKFARNPNEAIGLHLVHVPTPANSGDQRAAWRAGRTILHKTTFDQFEANAKDELTRILGAYGFDAGRDVAAISVYRWAHGYAYGANSLYDEEQEPEVPVVAHQRVGRIAIANSDAAWNPTAHRHRRGGTSGERVGSELARSLPAHRRWNRATRPEA
jgi:NAD(P)-binding Rossmann-like domain